MSSDLRSFNASDLRAFAASDLRARGGEIPTDEIRESFRINSLTLTIRLQSRNGGVPDGYYDHTRTASPSNWVWSRRGLVTLIQAFLEGTAASSYTIWRRSYRFISQEDFVALSEDDEHSIRDWEYGSESSTPTLEMPNSDLEAGQAPIRTGLVFSQLSANLDSSFEFNGITASELIVAAGATPKAPKGIALACISSTQHPLGMALFDTAFPDFTAYSTGGAIRVGYRSTLELEIIQ